MVTAGHGEIEGIKLRDPRESLHTKKEGQAICYQRRGEAPDAKEVYQSQLVFASLGSAGRAAPLERGSMFPC